MTRPAAPTAKSALVPVIAAVLGIVLIRVLLLHYSEYVYDEEEYKTGSIGALVMDGPTLPILEYQPGDYEGGTLFFGLLTMVFFAAFGKTFVALKSLAAATTILWAVCTILWARKMAGNRAAWAAAALCVLPIPYIQQITNLPWGNYAETAALSALTFLVFHGFLFENRRTVPRAVALGFLWGFGTWVHYGYLITAMTCVFVWYLTDKALWKDRRLYIAMAAALVGFAPWFAYNLTHHWWGIVRFGDALPSDASGNPLFAFVGRVWQLFSRDFAAGMHFRLGSLGIDKFAGYAYQALLLVGVTAFIRPLRRKLLDWIKAVSPRPQEAVEADSALAAAVPLIYAAAFAAAYSLSNYGLFAATWTGWDAETHCHIYQLYPALALVAAVAFGRTSGVWRRVIATAIALMLVLGLVGLSSMVDFSRPQSARLHAPAYDRDVIYMEIGSKWARLPDEVPKLLDRVPPHAKRSMSFGAGITYGLFHVGTIPVAVDKCAALPERYWPYCQVGIGTGLGSAGLSDEEIAKEVSTASAAAEPAIELGVAIGHIWFGRLDHPSIAQAADAPPPPLVESDEQDAFKQFMAGHLAMAQSRPGKD